MSDFYYNQIIEYIDGTFDENFEAAKRWAESNNARFVEIAPKSETIRQFQIIELSYEELYENVRQTREQLYKEQKDPITCQIQSLRDEEQTDEILAEIENLLVKRQAVVAEIKAANPYPVEPIEEIDELPVVEEVAVSEMEIVEE